MPQPPDTPPPDDDGEAVELELTDQLDLHSFHPREVAGIVHDYVEHAIAKGWREVRLIHGKGIGAMRETVHRALGAHPDVEAFGLAGDRSGWGATIARLGQPAIELRPLDESDDLHALTDLLHRAYAPLLKRGMRFVASWQDPDQTRRRCAAGETWLAVAGLRVVGTVTLMPPGRERGSPWLKRPDVALFGQFAVEPAWQGRGIGGRLMDHVERRAREMGAAHLALDTSEHATELIATYERRGFGFVEHVQWDATNYRSVVMSRPLA